MHRMFAVLIDEHGPRICGQPQREFCQAFTEGRESRRLLALFDDIVNVVLITLCPVAAARVRNKTYNFSIRRATKSIIGHFAIRPIYPSTIEL